MARGLPLDLLELGNAVARVFRGFGRVVVGWVRVVLAVRPDCVGGPDWARWKRENGGSERSELGF